MSWERDELDFLREATEVPERAVIELRCRVLAKAGRRRWFPWLWAPVACGLLLLAIAVSPEPRERLALPLPKAPAAPEVAVSRPAPAPAVRPPVKARARGAAVIQIETGDPDVVIYLVNSDGGGK